MKELKIYTITGADDCEGRRYSARFHFTNRETAELVNSCYCDYNQNFSTDNFKKNQSNTRSNWNIEEASFKVFDSIEEFEKDTGVQIRQMISQVQLTSNKVAELADGLKNKLTAEELKELRETLR